METATTDLEAKAEDPRNITPRPCPHCGGEPQFYNLGECDYDNDWVGKLGCCAEMETHIPFMQHRGLSKEEKDTRVKHALATEWNQRHEDMHITITLDAT